MNVLLSVLLTFLVTYGYATVAFVVFLSALGLPLPASTLLLAAGSFTVDGPLNFWSIVWIVSLVATLGDLMAYGVARRFGIPVSRYIRRFGITSAHLAQVDHYLDRWGVWYVFFSRWLVTPLCPPVNFAAGFRKYSVLKFTFFVFVGEFLWAFIYVFLGHLFGASWSSLVDYIDSAPDILAYVVIGVIASSIAWKMYTKKVY